MPAIVAVPEGKTVVRKTTPLAPFETEAGRPHPLGATVDKEGVNFSVFSRNATAVELLLFGEHDDVQPIQVIKFEAPTNQTFFFWHVYVKGLKPGIHYAYRVDGPQDLHGKGFRFNRNKVLVDPYALGNTKALFKRDDAVGPDDNLATSMRSVVIDVHDYDWEGDQPLGRPMEDMIIYEMHVGGFTRHPSSGVKHPGTFAGVIEKIPYLKELGITAVELLPVMQYDSKEVLRMAPDGSGPLHNYWGYSTINFFAPEDSYCVAPQEGEHLHNFRNMVKALHRANIAVIIDVVFNHTNEGNHQGPTLNFKGFGNEIYYHLVEKDRQYYMDYSGCGNTLNCNHPIVEKFIIECLEFWVREMHVDGFRFDEGSILARGQDGVPLAYPPVVWSIELSECLLDTRIIAEAWDAAGLYQIGYFPGFRWAEWNGRYRDDIRRFVKGDPGMIGALAARLAGSADIYQASGHLPINSVNFVTCHDGFTLNDLVSYNDKHNEANGECNRDGVNDNLSWNCGCEGATDDPAIDALRERQIKNFATILMLSRGVPMFVAGDEVRRTQKGNNNAYCQDNDISWFDWRLVEKNRSLLRFWKMLIAARAQSPHFRSGRLGRFFKGELNERGLPDIAWHGTELNKPGWNDPGARCLAYTLGGFDGAPDMHAVFNMYWEALNFEVPAVPGRRWYLVGDTSRPSPDDIVETERQVPIKGDHVRVEGRSVLVLHSR
jgi:glycogen operon protein